jgi:hypothetical protein
MTIYGSGFRRIHQPAPRDARMPMPRRVRQDLYRRLDTPARRVRWVLQFASRELPAERAARQKAWAALYFMQTRQQATFIEEHDATVLDMTHRLLRTVVASLARGVPSTVMMPAAAWTLHPPARRAKGGRSHTSANIGRTTSTGLDQRHMPSLVVWAFAEDLDSFGADRLRACPLERDGVRCGVIFLARGRKLFCSTPHAQAAAWQRYLESHPDRKKERRDYGEDTL